MWKSAFYAGGVCTMEFLLNVRALRAMAFAYVFLYHKIALSHTVKTVKLVCSRLHTSASLAKSLF